MLNTAYSAAAIALGCSAAVILFSSQSVILTIFSTLTIGFVLTAVTAMLAGIGWTLGFLESICFAILIGVSVDFVIHLSHAYSHKHGEISRGDRTKYAVVKMGPSILATALTTILSAVVMLFTTITFFQKFALILFFAIIQSTVGSFIFFLTLVDCIGPTNPTYLVDLCVSRCCTKKKSSSDVNHDDDDKHVSSKSFLTMNVTSRTNGDSSDGSD
jgi:predicted RND superfamily exporter protein